MNKDEGTARPSLAATTHWVFAAAEAHRELAGCVEEGPESWQRAHLLHMLDTIKAGMSPTKACRWLGWIQAAMCFGQIATLEELKAINRAASDAAPSARSHTATTGAEEREGLYEKMWMDFVSLQRGDARGVIAQVETWFLAGCPKPPSATRRSIPVAEEVIKALRELADGYFIDPAGEKQELTILGRTLRETIVAQELARLTRGETA